jgi:hypothetical protein
VVLVRSLMSLMVAVMGVGCVADEPVPPAGDDRLADEVEVDVSAGKGDEAIDICALAAQLPDDDICSLICDYEAFKQRALDNGMEPGACYTFRCTLPGDVGVNVGVCSPAE